MFKLFKLFGITVSAHWSLVILLGVCIMASIGNDSAPIWFRVASGLMLGLILSLSILFHEFGHALVGRKYGIRFSKITLLFLGGAAHMDNKIPNAKSEFFMALAGPGVSFVLAAIGFVGKEIAVGADGVCNPGACTSSLAAVFFILYYMNLVLAVFNIIPISLPLDGSRMLRAMIWHFVKSHRKATQITLKIGTVGIAGLGLIAVLMIADVSVPFFGTGVGGAIWILIMAGFLYLGSQAEKNALNDNS